MKSLETIKESFITYYPIRTLDSIGSVIVSPNSNNYIIGNYKEPLCTTWMAKYILDN